MSKTTLLFNPQKNCLLGGSMKRAALIIIFFVLMSLVPLSSPVEAGVDCACHNGYMLCIMWDDVTGDYTGSATYPNHPDC
jgi:hypothetical protein